MTAKEWGTHDAVWCSQRVHIMLNDLIAAEARCAKLEEEREMITREALWLLDNAPDATDNDNDGALYPDLMAEWYGRSYAFRVNYCAALATVKED